jgi:hypothetical protein
MAAKNCGESMVSVVRTGSTQTLHLITGSTRRGMVTFVCEFSVMTIHSHGLPARCPICGIRNPLRGEQEKK